MTATTIKTLNLANVVSDAGKGLKKYKLKDSFDIPSPDGSTWKAQVWQCPHRSTGRRIQVRNYAGEGLFDSDDCYDIANARAALDNWLEQGAAS